ncbi:hypothetical protein JYU34_004056 [Plutella xylostella]|uniref:Uncharacterized protein n=1 Tax=Plutella xylostella TaxID=51655 RepID=A0ABQ7QX02_PLUXY|nr:hypothetical protein JYU34_004056 [Plutella xylostella]
MAGLPSVLAVLLLSGLVAAGPPSYLVPVEHRGISPYASFGNVQIQPIEQLPPNTLYQYTIVPRDEVAVQVVAEENTDLSLIALWDCIPSVSTALTVAGSTAIAIGSWVLVKLPVILIGAALVIGLCAFTPYCTLTITKPGFLKDCQNLIPAVPSLDDIEDFAKHAFHKFNELNEVYKKK